MHSQMEKQGEETMKKGFDCVHVSMDRREDVQWQETRGGETEGQGQENEDQVRNDRAKNSTKKHWFISLLNHSTQTKQW